MLKRITALLALVFLLGTTFNAPTPALAAEESKEINESGLTVTAILVGEKNENYDFFVAKFAEMGITVQLTKQVDLPDPSVLFPPAGGTLDVWWNATLLLEKNNILPVDWTDLILVSTPEPYVFEGQQVYPGITDVVKCPDGTEWPGRLKPVRNTDILGINSIQAGIHGVAHSGDVGAYCDWGSFKVDIANDRLVATADYQQEWLKLAQYDGTTHVIGQASMRDLLGTDIALNDPTYIDFRTTEDGVDGWFWVPGHSAMDGTGYYHEVWLLKYREKHYNFLTNWVNWLHEGQTVTHETFADTSDRIDIAAVIGITNGTDTYQSGTYAR